MSSSGYPPNQGAFSTEQSRYPPHSVQYTFPSTRHQQEFAVPDYRSSHLEVSQASQLFAAIVWLHIWVLYSVHWSSCLFLCQYHAVFYYIAL
uniref:Uncharacterized protein n=1 Tax=Castor canadensis TaxID=51338 RepID=A0A8C0XBD7_CASCN